MTTAKLNPETERFFSAIEPLSGGDGDITFNFIALRVGDRHVIFRARLYFNNGTTPGPLTLFETSRIKAGQYHLTQLAMSARDLAAQLIKGEVNTPDGILYFPMDSYGNTHFTFNPYHEAGLANQNRWNILNISTPGVRFEPIELDWELKASPSPFDSLLDLSSIYALGPVSDQRSIVELVALNVIAVDVESRVVGTRAEIKVRLMNGLAPDRAHVGYRIMSNGQVVNRGSIHGGEMNWQTRDGLQNGSADVSVPNAAVVQCIACYNGIAQSAYWIMDNAHSQNPRRSTFEAFDNGLEMLKDFLQRSPKQGTARDIESGVAWLLWLLGFSVAHLGSNSRTQDSVDIIANTPSGHFAVIECTTSLLQADSKLPKLIARTAEFKSRLEKSNNGHLRVLPAIATSRSRSEISGDLEQAEKLGILVLAREELETGVSRTLLIPDAEEYYRLAEEAIRVNLEKHSQKSEDGKTVQIVS